MTAIDKLTQGYDAAEDRLFIDVSVEGGEARRLWLTQRLASALVQHLCSWLDEHLAATASGHHDARLHAFEQQAAAAALMPDTAVQRGRTASLIHSIDLDRGNQSVRISFRAAGETSGPGMTLDALHLRQWLGILRGLFDQAGWSASVWPTWLVGAAASHSRPSASLH